MCPRESGTHKDGADASDSPPMTAPKTKAPRQRHCSPIGGFRRLCRLSSVSRIPINRAARLVQLFAGPDTKNISPMPYIPPCRSAKR